MRRRTPLACLVLCVASSCATRAPAVSPQTFAERFIAAEDRAWASGDVSDLKALEEDNVVYHLAGVELKGWKSHEDYILNGRKSVSDLKQTWKYLSGEGNHFAMTYGAKAISLPTADTPAANVTADYLFFFQLRDQKVVEVWVNGTVTSSKH